MDLRASKDVANSPPRKQPVAEEPGIVNVKNSDQAVTKVVKTFGPAPPTDTFGEFQYPEIKTRRMIQLPSRIAIWLIRFYQVAVSPLLGPRCRFRPTCSEYAIQAIQKYGLLRGSRKGIVRLLKCHPFHPGGVDPP